MLAHGAHKDKNFQYKHYFRISVNIISFILIVQSEVCNFFKILIYRISWCPKIKKISKPKHYMWLKFPLILIPHFDFCNFLKFLYTFWTLVAQNLEIFKTEQYIQIMSVAIFFLILTPHPPPNLGGGTTN